MCVAKASDCVIMHAVIDMFTIYKITNTLNLKLYVGQTTKSIEKRFLQHAKANSPRGEAMRQCVLDNFTIEVIEICEKSEHARKREMFWIKVLKCKMPNGYNRSNGGEGNIHKLKTPLSNQEVLRMSVSSKIITLREHCGLNQKELAENLHMNRSVLNRIENGTRPVRDDEQKKLLSGFDTLNSAGRNLLVGVLNSLRVSHAAIA